MIKQWISQIKDTERSYLLFLAATGFLGLAQSVEGATLNNFLKDQLHIEILQRSALEFPRELPGLLVFLVIGLLSTIKDIRIAALANAIAAVGMLLLGLLTPNYLTILIFIFVYSIGQHTYMPLSSSIGMDFANNNEVGKTLGKISAVNTAALVLGSALLCILFKFAHLSYSISFSIGAAALLCASILFMLMPSKQCPKSKTRFVFRKEYNLYYWLCVLFGARKQIFITFGPWVLVDVFKQPVSTMTILFFIISVLGIWIKPFIGCLVDRVGEKMVLGGEAVLFFIICLGYAFSENLFTHNIALLIICGCYVIDQSMSAVNMARSTYMKKISLYKEEVLPSLSLGTSIDHIVSMFLPFLGGILWYSFGHDGYKLVFLGGAVIALLNLISTKAMKLT